MQGNSNFKSNLMVVKLCLIAFLLQSYGAIADCNDSKAKDDVIKTILSTLNSAVWYRESAFAFTSPKLINIKTLAHNAALKKYNCSGKYSFAYNEKPREIEVAYNLSFLEDTRQTEVLLTRQ